MGMIILVAREWARALHTKTVIFKKKVSFSIHMEYNKLYVVMTNFSANFLSLNTSLTLPYFTTFFFVGKS